MVARLLLPSTCGIAAWVYKSAWRFPWLGVRSWQRPKPVRPVHLAGACGNTQGSIATPPCRLKQQLGYHLDSCQTPCIGRSLCTSAEPFATTLQQFLTQPLPLAGRGENSRSISHLSQLFRFLLLPPAPQRCSASWLLWPFGDPRSNLKEGSYCIPQPEMRSCISLQPFDHHSHHQANSPHVRLPAQMQADCAIRIVKT